MQVSFTLDGGITVGGRYGTVWTDWGRISGHCSNRKWQESQQRVAKGDGFTDCLKDRIQTILEIPTPGDAEWKGSKSPEGGISLPQPPTAPSDSLAGRAVTDMPWCSVAQRRMLWRHGVAKVKRTALRGISQWPKRVRGQCPLKRPQCVIGEESVSWRWKTIWIKIIQVAEFDFQNSSLSKCHVFFFFSQLRMAPDSFLMMLNACHTLKGHV